MQSYNSNIQIRIIDYEKQDNDTWIQGTSTSLSTGGLRIVAMFMDFQSTMHIFKKVLQALNNPHSTQCKIDNLQNNTYKQTINNDKSDKR